MFIIPILIGLCTILSPFLGMLFLMRYSGRIWLNSYRHIILTYLSVLIVIAIIALSQNDVAVWLNAADGMIGVVLAIALFILVAKSGNSFSLGLSIAVLFIFVYSLSRTWLFAPTLNLISDQLHLFIEQVRSNSADFKLTEKQLQWISQILIRYQTAIWGIVHISGLFLGIILFNQTSVIKFHLRSIKYPYPMIYFFIVSLMLVLWTKTRLLGANLVICMTVVYLLQGIGVISHFWGDIFERAKFMKVLMIMAIILNYPILILISLVGVLDVWFDFRKLTKREETNEDNPY